MKRITKTYNPLELSKILKLMEEGFDETKPMTSIVMFLYKAKYKIVSMDELGIKDDLGQSAKICAHKT